MAFKVVLTIVILLLLVIAGGLITGQFDIHPAAAIALALVIIGAAAFMTGRRRR